VGNEVRKLGGGRQAGKENFGVENGAEKALGRGRRCVFGSS
jgi:hypothetical protein